MAMKPKKSSSSKRKTTSKKVKSTLKKNILIIISVLAVIALVVFGYFLGQKIETRPIKKENVLEDLSKLKTKKPKDKALKKPLPHKQEEEKKQITKVSTKKLDKEITPTPKVKNVLLAYRGKKPKLAIVIDDVHTKKQLEMIQRLNMKITPSIFPPYELAKESHLLAKNLKHYMIHLPMESANRKLNTQSKTLMTSFSDEQIADRVMELRKLFPKGRYVNNHTGSVFTSHYTVMKKLYIALRLEGFVFVDSFTQATSKVEKIAHEYGDAYVRRDSFIDNIQTVKYVQKQLKLAVQKAKKNGHAVVIGHPHKVTMQALKHSTSILKEVEVVYIDEMYRRK